MLQFTKTMHYTLQTKTCLPNTSSCVCVCCYCYWAERNFFLSFLRRLYSAFESSAASYYKKNRDNRIASLGKPYSHNVSDKEKWNLIEELANCVALTIGTKTLPNCLYDVNKTVQPAFPPSRYKEMYLYHTWTRYPKLEGIWINFENREGRGTFSAHQKLFCDKKEEPPLINFHGEIVLKKHSNAPSPVPGYDLYYIVFVGTRHPTLIS